MQHTGKGSSYGDFDSYRNLEQYYVNKTDIFGKFYSYRGKGFYSYEGLKQEFASFCEKLQNTYTKFIEELPRVRSYSSFFQEDVRKRVEKQREILKTLEEKFSLAIDKIKSTLDVEKYSMIDSFMRQFHTYIQKFENSLTEHEFRLPEYSYMQLLPDISNHKILHTYLDAFLQPRSDT